ncbi:unnamed protein product, partial [Schistosoma turkestanicum]
ILKGIKHFWKHKNDEDKESVLLQNSILLTHPTFLSLLQVCLPDADFLIDSLYEQIEYFILNARNIADRVPDNLRTRQIVQQCLKYRLILIGQKFQSIQSDTDICSRWAILLAQLISHGVTEPESNSSLFFMVYDMLQILIHTLAARSGIEGKHYQSVAKKIRRELSERPPCSGIEYLRPLLLLTKGSLTVFVTGRQSRVGSRGGSSNISGGSLGTGGGGGGLGTGGAGGGGSGGPGGVGSGGGNSSNKSSHSKGSGKAGNSLLLSGGSRFLNSSSNSMHHQGGSGGVGLGNGGQLKKPGYQLLGKERFNPWEIYDPSKQPLLLSIHGAVNTESVLSRIEEQANRLIRHDHFHRMSRPPEFYMVPIYPPTVDEDQPVNNRKQCDIRENENVNIMINKTIKTENPNINNNNNIDGMNNVITNNSISSSLFKKDHDINDCVDIMRESQLLSLNDMIQISETNLSDCSNQFLPINSNNNNNHNNTVINNINIRNNDLNSNYHHQSTNILSSYDQKHNISSVSYHPTSNLMFTESNPTMKSVHQIDRANNPNMMMSMMMMMTTTAAAAAASATSSVSTTNTAINSSNSSGNNNNNNSSSSSIQLGHGKLMNARNDCVEINDTSLSMNNHMNTFQQPSSSVSLGVGGVGGAGGGGNVCSGGVPSSSASFQMHSHAQQIHAGGHHHHQQQQILLNSNQPSYTTTITTGTSSNSSSSTSSTRKLPSQQTSINDYSNLNEFDRRSMHNVINHGITIPGQMNTITYPPPPSSHQHQHPHSHNQQIDSNLHKTNKSLGIDYNDRLIGSQSLTQSSSLSQQQIQMNPTGVPPSIAPPPSNNIPMLSTPMNNNVVTGHVMTSSAKTTTTKRKRGSGRRGGGSGSGNNVTDRNSVRSTNNATSTRGGIHPTGPTNVVGYERMNSNNNNNNVYSYNVINAEQPINESNHQWTSKQNVYNMNVLEMQQQHPQPQQQSSSSSTRGHHHQQQHLANLSGFLRNRAQQHHQQQQQQQQQQQHHHPEQSSYGSTSFNETIPVVLPPHQGHVFDQSQLNNQFNQSNTHLIDNNTSGSLRRHLTSTNSNSGGGNLPRSMIQQSHQLLNHPTTTTATTSESSQHMPSGMPNPPPYPINNNNHPSSQQYSLRIHPSSSSSAADEVVNPYMMMMMMNVNESNVDEQFKRQSTNTVMNHPIHPSASGTPAPAPTIMSRSSTVYHPSQVNHHHHHHIPPTDIQSQQHQQHQQQQHLSYIPSQMDTQLNQSRLMHSRVMNQSQQQQQHLHQQQSQSGQMIIRSDQIPPPTTATPIMNTGNNNNNNTQQPHLANNNIPHSSHSRYTPGGY